MKTVFLSIGLRETHPDEDFPPRDTVYMQATLNAIFSAVAADPSCRLVLRDHPAVTPWAEAALGNDGTQIVLVPAEADATTIAREHKPDLVFFLGGQDDVARDYAVFSGHFNTIAAPLPGTGGAAEAIDKKMDRMAQERLDGQGRRDTIGFERIARLIPHPRS